MKDTYPRLIRGPTAKGVPDTRRWTTAHKQANKLCFSPKASETPKGKSKRDQLG